MLRAIPDAGVAFTGWSGDASGTGLTTTFSMTTNKSVTATFVAPSLILTSPNGGEIWNRGAVHAITWTYTGAPGPIKIELLKGGVVVSTLKASAPLGTNGSGSFNWNIPGTRALGTDYRIRITSSANTNITDTSAADFAIVPKNAP
jgi:hypothetical protein